MSTPASRCTAFRALPWLARINALGLCAAAAAFAALLWPQWLHDDNLTHGLFLPFLSGILAVESRRDPGARFLRPGAWPPVACAFLSLASMASVALAVIYAAAMGWSHSLAEFMLAAALVLALAASWLAFADRRVRFIPLNWAAAVAVFLWLFAGPPPPGSYARLALSLQGRVTDGVVSVLNAVGIAAFQDGNVIELARTSVGVSEACSGVRSLISCTVAGLFLSALLVRRPWHRALVIVLSPVIGLAMNFLRSLLLTLLANAGVSIEGRWHDLTGASILAGTTLLVTALALWLHRREPPQAACPAETAPGISGHSPLQAMVAATLLVAAGAAGFVVASSRPVDAGPGRAPDLAALLPDPPPGWTAQTTPDMDQFSGVLHTHALVERVYSAGSSPDSAHLTLYLAYWRPGQASVSMVDAHTPDACWPGTGWESEPVPIEHAVLAIGGRTLATAECRLFAHGRFRTNVWFWHLYGGRPLNFVDPYSAARLIGTTWRYGFGRAEDQLFVRVSSDRPWEEIASQPALRQFISNLKPLGL
ncbi:MAG TPA: exosortase/archaeosortase family protein [Opitutaceae bacterium]|nr:exosortase/archaeosortase family protein [Opitutaceae bacterium]